jgi:hypothetical protein
MSGYKRQIASGAILALVLAAVLGFGVLTYLPAQPPTSSTTITTSESSVTTVTSTSTVPVTSTTSTTTMYTSASTTATITSSSTSTVQTVTYTNQTVPLDSRLAVTPLGNLSSSTNATTIAIDLASGLGELPIQLVSEHLSTCFFTCDQSIYSFSTAKDSNITVFLVGGSFYLLLYQVQNYSTYLDAWTNQTTWSPPTVGEDIAVSNLMLRAYGLDLSRVGLDANSTGPGWSTWNQEYQGLPIVNSSQITFNVYQPTSLIFRLEIIAYAGWNVIPSGFPLNVTATEALASAQGYATNTIHIGNVTSATIAFQIIQGHMYYAATISSQSRAYILYVNPDTSEVGFPTA